MIPQTPHQLHNQVGVGYPLEAAWRIKRRSSLVLVIGAWGVRQLRKILDITPTARRSSDYRSYLRRLEELKDSGEITEATYRLLKSEYENKSQGE